MSILVEISRGVPPILKMDPNVTPSEGLRVDSTDGKFNGTIRRIQVEVGSFWVGIDWDGAAPQGTMAGGGLMALESFLLSGPRPTKE